jgi:hypothetical protein
VSRVIDNQTNLWGRTSGLEAQRSDFWIVDFKDALAGLNLSILYSKPMTDGLAAFYLPPKLQSYFAQSVTLPELKVRAEPIRRDSRAYPTPAWEEALEPITMTFILDSYTSGATGTANRSPYKSDIYQMLDGWRMVVRAGRGPMSGESSIRLNTDYRIDYCFDVRLLLLRGCSNPRVYDTAAGQKALMTASALAGAFGFSTLQTVGEAVSNYAADNSVINDLEFSMEYRLVNCWLGGFKISDLSYEAAKIVTLSTTFYADDIQQVPQNAT